MKKIRRIFNIIVFLCYLAATIVKSDFWGNILSPIITLEAFFIVYKVYFKKESRKEVRILGLLLSFGLLSWAAADIMWALSDMILHSNPEQIWIITFCYAMTNIFFTISISFYGYSVFRKWNMVQVLLDSIVISFFVVEFIWIVFLNENSGNVAAINNDVLSTSSILLDILLITWIVIWFMSVRNGKVPSYLKLMTLGLILYSISDLVYFYQYFFCDYEPNSIIDAVYEASFWLIGLSALARLKEMEVKSEEILYNIGSKGKGYYLLIAPVLLTIFKGIDGTNLLKFVSVILIYQLLSTYIQNNIQKEKLLQKETELNHELELKVKARTEELEEKNQVLHKLLDQDFVTGLKNRRYLLANLDNTISHLNEGDTIVLLYIDINRFKVISTMFGNYIGDLALYEMAEKLKPMEKLAEHTILTSYGDDTFVFAAIGQYDYKQGYDFALKAIQLCSDIYQIEGYQIRITVNVGVSVYPKDSTSKEELIRHANLAMSQARNHGFNLAREFDASLSEAIFRRNTIELMLKRANIDQEFRVYYQPQLQIADKKLIGFEALLRWKTQSGEMVSPAEFIPVAEETGYILPIGDWVMTRAIRQLSEWNSRYHSKIMIGINVSLKQLTNLQFMKRLVEEMEQFQIDPEWIDLEITETLQPQENPELINMLEEIRKLGVKISIDDFGTGYSSLSYLKNLPVDRIKLAKELVDYIHTDDFDYELVKAIILLSKAKKIRVIAEGVETEEQWKVLKDLKCDEVQGFYFGRPEPPEVIEAALFGEMR